MGNSLCGVKKGAIDVSDSAASSRFAPGKSKKSRKGGMAAPGEEQQQQQQQQQAPTAGHRGSVAILPLDAGDGTKLKLTKSILGLDEATDVTKRYQLSWVLGRGAFATTRLCIDRETGRQLACKSIHKQRLEGLTTDWSDVRREMQVMYHLSGHPNMVQLVDTFEDNAYVHLVMELCAGGELVDRIIDKGSYTERDAATIIRTVLEIVAYAHDMGCVHRDIKPDNLLILDQADDAPLKLADWGFSTFIKPGEKLKGLCGTAYYIAPEVLYGSYDERADVWSCGVVLYVLLSGRPPFSAVRDEDVFRQIVEDGVPNMFDDPWPSISDAAKDAVRKMMTWHPDQRPSARQMLNHEWIRVGGVAGDNVIQPEVLHRMKSFAAMNKFKKHAAMVIATHLPKDQIKGLKELFKAIDKDGNGTITADELRQALEARGSKLPAGELEQLMAVADVNGDGSLEYTEFLATTLHQSRLCEADNLLYAFQHFDKDGDGLISAAELRDALVAGGEKSTDDVEDIIRAVDQDGDGQIDYQEFVAMMISGCESSGCGTGDGDGRSAMGAALGMTQSGRVPSDLAKALSSAARRSSAATATTSNGSASVGSIDAHRAGGSGSAGADNGRARVGGGGTVASDCGQRVAALANGAVVGAGTTAGFQLP